MLSELYWLGERWPGRVALAARPRGGDWLRDEIRNWKQAGIDLIVSLLTPEEERDLELREESRESRAQGLEFISFPIPDCQVPKSEPKLAETLEKISDSLLAGKDVVIHCRQGVGRTGLVTACLLVKNGMSPGAAIENISVARGVAVPETAEQREWVDHFATALTK
jgi:protein-tyrosine phosphatase